MISPDAKTNNSTQEVLEPHARMRQLIEMSHNISVDKNISISRYFHSGKELIKSASQMEQKSDIERAFVLYLRYMTLFLEKLIHHPEYSKADRAEKALVRSECNRVFELAENLKKHILEKYTEEYEKFKHENKEQANDTNSIQKRSINQQNCSPKEPGVDEIDRKFDFSQQPSDIREDKGFDPFNIDELRQSFNNS